MSKVRYTVKTEGSRTIVHRLGKAGEMSVWPSTTGKFVEGPPGDTPRGTDKPQGTDMRAKRKKGK
jgi:hypothetical protein